jgi:hypothetical protein
VFLFPLLLGEENVLHSHFGDGCSFYALKTKLRLRKREKRLLCIRNKVIFPSKSKALQKRNFSKINPKHYTKRKD